VDVSHVSGYETQRLAARRCPWRDNLVLTAIIALPAVLTGFVAFSSLSQPADEEIAARFFAHEADFQRLIAMLRSDGRRLRGARDPLSLGDLVADGANGDSYRLLLATVGATDLRYFPESGRIMVRIAASDVGFTGMSKFYLYTGDAGSKPSFPTRRYSLRAPGVAPTNGDFHIQGGWFVHREGAVVASSAPY
jgi:hypothetical protein